MSEKTFKHILITGGSKGIGRAITKKLLTSNFKVSVFARDKISLQQLSDDCNENNLATFSCDVSNETDVQEKIQSAISKFGPAYGLICCAGIHGPLGKFWQTSTEEWESAFKVNVFGSMYAIRAAYPSMKTLKGGHIVLFSGGGQAAMPGFSAYVGSKGSVWRLTETLAVELEEDSIMINAIAPGAVDTGLQDQVIAAGPEKVTSKYFEQIKDLKAKGGTSPDFAANLCDYLMSEASMGLTGKTLSAVWDKPQEFEDIAKISSSDIYTYKRVIDKNGNTRF